MEIWPGRHRLHVPGQAWGGLRGCSPKQLVGPRCVLPTGLPQDGCEQVGGVVPQAGPASSPTGRGQGC